MAQLYATSESAEHGSRGLKQLLCVMHGTKENENRSLRFQVNTQCAGGPSAWLTDQFHAVDFPSG